jgi:hypothetical protein
MRNTAKPLATFEFRVIRAAAVIFLVVASIAQASAGRIDKISIGGQFSGSDVGPVYSMADTPFGFGDGQSLKFGGSGVPFDLTVVFDIDNLGTQDLGNGLFSDLVKIQYKTLAGTSFLGNAARLEFSGLDIFGHPMVIDAADYTKGTPSKRGWVLTTPKLPSELVTFHAQEFTAFENGAPNSAFFLLDYSYHLTPVPVPAAFPLLAGGVAVLGFVGWRCRRSPGSNSPISCRM